MGIYVINLYIKQLRIYWRNGIVTYVLVSQLSKMHESSIYTEINIKVVYPAQSGQIKHC